MKYVFTILFALLLAAPVWAISWQDTNQVTIAWDPPTTLSNGDPIPETDTIVNKIFIAPNQDKTQKVSVGETPNSQFTITLDNEGKYLVGVKSIRNNAAGDKLSESVIAWSDDPAVVARDEFGISHFYSPEPASNLQPN